MDGLFQMPAQTFLYVHRVRVLNFTEEDLADQQSDENGVPVPVVKDANESPVIMGYVGLPNPRVEGRTQRMDAICRVPAGTEVDEFNSMIEVLEDQPNGIMTNLVGTYKVFQVRPNPLDIRLLLKRPAKNGIDRGTQPYEDDPYGD